MYWDRFDICEAYYLYCADYHSGQWSKEYAALGTLDRIDFRPGANLRLSGLPDNGKAIYTALVANPNNLRDRS